MSNEEDPSRYYSSLSRFITIEATLRILEQAKREYHRYDGAIDINDVMLGEALLSPTEFFPHIFLLPLFLFWEIFLSFSASARDDDGARIKSERASVAELFSIISRISCLRQ